MLFNYFQVHERKAKMGPPMARSPFVISVATLITKVRCFCFAYMYFLFFFLVFCIRSLSMAQKGNIGTGGNLTRIGAVFCEFSLPPCVNFMVVGEMQRVID